MSDFVIIPYTRTFPHPLDEAYAWLTDYQDDDPGRTDAVLVRRPVLERSERKVVLDGTVRVLGRSARGRSEVTLEPPDHWVARITGGNGRGSEYDYRLTPVAGGCRLDVVYRLRVRRPSTRLQIALFRPLIRRRIHRMWEGFAASMASDLARAPAR